MAENVSKGANKHGPKFSRIQIPSNGNIDYEDFPEGVPFLQLAGSENDNIYGTPKKRYRKCSSILISLAFVKYLTQS